MAARSGTQECNESKSRFRFERRRRIELTVKRNVLSKHSLCVNDAQRMLNGNKGKFQCEMLNEISFALDSFVLTVSIINYSLEIKTRNRATMKITYNIRTKNGKYLSESTTFGSLILFLLLPRSFFLFFCFSFNFFVPFSLFTLFPPSRSTFFSFRFILFYLPPPPSSIVFLSFTFSPNSILFLRWKH